MTDKKKLVINSATCDMRNITREILTSYDDVMVNCALAVVSPEAQLLLAEHAVKINAASVMNLSKDTVFISKNGGHTIARNSAVPAQPQAIVVNGNLVIEAGTEAYLEKCQAIVVNGLLQCPESMAGAVGKAVVNGITEIYPDGAVLLKPRFRIDKVFALRARAEKYFVSRRLVALNGDVDYEKLLTVGAAFLTPRVLAAEGVLERVLPLIPETAEVDLVPDGTAYIDDDVEIDSDLLRQYGRKLFVEGDAVLEDAEVLNGLDYLEVTGLLEVREGLLEAASAKIKVRGAIRTMDSGTRIRERVSVVVDEKLLAACPEGVVILECGEVTLSESLSDEIILEKVKIRECGSVVCTEQQKPVVTLVCEDVGNIGPDAGLKMAAGEDTAVINVAQYTF